MLPETRHRVHFFLGAFVVLVSVHTRLFVGVKELFPLVLPLGQRRSSVTFKRISVVEMLLLRLDCKARVYDSLHPSMTLHSAQMGANQLLLMLLVLFVRLLCVDGLKIGIVERKYLMLAVIVGLLVAVFNVNELLNRRLASDRLDSL